jgi:hypothetical protein
MSAVCHCVSSPCGETSQYLPCLDVCISSMHAVYTPCRVAACILAECHVYTSGRMAVYTPGLMAVYTPGWMAVYTPGWMAVYTPGWMAVYTPDWMAIYTPGWMAVYVHPWLHGCIPGWMAVYTPGGMAEYTPGWMPVVLDSTGRTNEFAPILQYLGQKSRDRETSLAAGGRRFMFGTTGGGLIVR